MSVPRAVQVGQRLDDLVVRLAHPRNDRRLRGQLGGLGPGQHRQAAGVAGRGPHRPLQAGHGLDVVVEHVGPGVEDRSKCLRVAAQIADQGLDAGAGHPGAHRGDRLGHRRGAAVGKVVPGHHRHNHVCQAHTGRGLSHPARLAGIDGAGVPGVDQAESTGAGASLAEDHERRGAVVPTLRDVGAARLLAHRDQIEAAQRGADLAELRARPERHPHPLRFACPQRKRLALIGAVVSGLRQTPQQPGRDALARRGVQTAVAAGCQHHGVTALLRCLAPPRPVLAKACGLTGERRHVGSRQPVGDIGPIDAPVAGPDPRGTLGDQVDNLTRRHIHALGLQRRDTQAGDPARNDPVEPP